MRNFGEEKAGDQTPFSGRRFQAGFRTPVTPA